MAGIIDEAVDACRPAMDTRLQHSPSSTLVRAEVDGDPVRLVQILCNLLDNASKYTQDGGDIRLSVEVANAAIVMTVTDSGIGITRETCPMSSSRSYRTHATAFNETGWALG